MYLATPFLADLLKLSDGFHTFRRDARAEMRGDSHDGPNDGCSIGIADLADEGPIDLDLVEWETAQIAQRRIAGAEIVERDANAEVSQPMQAGDHRLGVLHEHTLGDFQFEAVRRETRLGQCRPDALFEPRLLELDGRDVDGDAQVMGPGRGFPACLLQSPSPKRDDQPRLFCQRDELVGCDHAASGVGPPHQRLEADDPVVGQTQDRLIMQGEAAADDGLSHLQLELHPGLDGRIHASFVEAVSIACGFLGSVEGEVGIPDQDRG